MKVFLDWDDTLFNTRDFIKDLSLLFVPLGISSDVYTETRKHAYVMFDAITDVYDIELHLAQFVKNKADFDIIEAARLVDIFLEDTSKYVFADVRQFLENMKEKKVDCYILSFGQSDFQRKKIAGAGLNGYFRDVLIVQNEKYKTMAFFSEDSKESVWFFDDRVEYIDTMKQMLPWVKIVQVSRKEGRYHDDQSSATNGSIQSFENMTQALFM